MTVSSVDTAELPRVTPQVPAGPVVNLDLSPVLDPPVPPTVSPVLDLPAVAEPVFAPVLDLPATAGPPPIVAVPSRAPICRGRLELRAERRQQRRQRRLYAFLGLSVLALTLGLAIVVLDVVR